MDTLNHLIENFSIDLLKQLFRQKISSFKAEDEDYAYLFDDNETITESYSEIVKIGEADLSNSDDLLVITAKTSEALSKRSGKKRQYDIAKKILKEENKDAAFFIFYDESGQFRFSFIRTNYLGTKRDFTDFKRYTYFVSPQLTNTTFKKQFDACQCNDLKSILEAFSVEPLNKLFYSQISESFYGLIGGTVGSGNKTNEYTAVLKIPGFDVQTHRKIYQEFAVRLIGRTIFVWFLKNKTSDANLPLIPADWLSSEKVKTSKDYYHTLLEKLFFEILNKPFNERMEGLPAGQEIIPFLNGGLFEPQREDFYKTGFGGFSQYNNTLLIPDEWTLKLFETLEQFNFTIDENSLNDQEVSIDPEMLGTIFENLLAEIDPNTEKSARKSTGSFYTPREIVDYMVEESLVSYLKNKTNTDEEKLHQLFKENELAEDYFEHKKQLIDAFNDIKILDPACGSGAFPMGALQKINLALQKLDPDAKLWKAKQLAKIDNAIYRQALREKLDKSNVEYIRKLGIIQHSIYGVDIQPIATEISKLRSFLSLVVDENIDDNEDNRGIYPLPNLEFKFVTANTLIGLEQDKAQVALDFGDTNADIDELQNLRDTYLQAFGEEKEKLKQQFLSLQKLIAQKEFNQFGTINKKAQQIIGWNPFSHEKSDWFDAQWMFGITGFNIVIGNPPYVSFYGNTGSSLTAQERQYYALNYNCIKKENSRINAMNLMTERGLNLLELDGHLSFITNKTLAVLPSYIDVRDYILKKTKINYLVTDLYPFDAIVDCIVIGLNKGDNSDNYLKWFKGGITKYEFINSSSFKSNSKLELHFSSHQSILNKIENAKNILSELITINRGVNIGGCFDDFLSTEKITDLYWKYISGTKNIKRYSYTWDEKDGYLVLI